MLSKEDIEAINRVATLLAAEHTATAAEMLEPAMREVVKHYPNSGLGARERWAKALKLLGDQCHVIAKWQS